MNLETDNKIQKKGITLVIPNPCGNIKETKMKNSGIEWIGEIPEDWEVKKVKHSFVRKNEKAMQENPIVLSLARSGVRERDISNNEGQLAESYYNYNPVDVDDLLINPMDLYSGANCSISKVKGVISPAYINLRAKKNVSPVFYDYYFKVQYWMMAFFAHGNGVSFENRWTLNNETLQNYPIVAPSFDTQQRIASYLDKKCSKIEETIQNQQQVIEKLKAYKQSLITEAVTGKKYHENCHTDSILLTQNPNEDMKTEIPLGISNPCGNIEFKYCNLGFIADFKNGLNYNASDFGTEVKFLGVGDFQNYLVLNDESMFSNIITDTEIEDDYYLKNGDIIFVRSNGSKELVGRAIMVDNIDFKVTYSGFCIRLRNKEPKKFNSKFLLYFFRSDYFRNELQRLSQGSNISNINQDLLSHIKIPLVDIRFQESVVDFLNKKCTAIDTAIEQKQNLIEKLTEYKKSLIYECVTGKKEI